MMLTILNNFFFFLSYSSHRLHIYFDPIIFNFLFLFKKKLSSSFVLFYMFPAFKINKIQLNLKPFSFIRSLFLFRFFQCDNFDIISIEQWTKKTIWNRKKLAKTNAIYVTFRGSRITLKVPSFSFQYIQKEHMTNLCLKKIVFHRCKMYWHLRVLNSVI